MADTKLKLKDLGTIHLMALDTSSLFLPFGRPISDYLRGEAGNQNGSKALLKQGPIDFSPAIRWNDSIGSLLQTTGFGELEREGLNEPDATVTETPDPAVADFLPFDPPGFTARESNPAKISPAVAHEGVPITVPRISTLPLRPRMTFGPPPAPQKTAPAVGSKPSPAPAAKSGPAIVATPVKAPPVAPARPSTPVPPAKGNVSTTVQTKPSAPIPPAPKPSGTVAPASRVTVMQPPAASPAKPSANPKTVVPAAPAARVPESIPGQTKSAPTPTRTPGSPSARPSENAVPTVDPAAVAKSAPAPPPTAKAPTPVIKSKPLIAPIPTEQPPARETILRESSVQKESRPSAETAPAATFEPNLGGADTGGLLERIPMVVKIGVALLAIAGGLYFTVGKSGNKPAEANRPVFVGEQGWATEWASDTVGSRRARQLSLYRPSMGMSDYQFQFTGQIESKAIGWVFRALDTKNYYAMKIENSRPGMMSLTHFAVVDGRESSYSQKPLTVDARPGSSYKVKLDVTGPRFTVSVQGEPVDFWTDNRLKAGSVGMMNERDERGIASAVQFSFLNVAK